MSRRRAAAATLLPLLLAVACPPSSAEPTVEFRLAGATTAELDLSQLLARIRPVDVAIATPFTAKPKRYRALPLHAVLDLAFGAAWRGDEYSDVSFVATDGYNAVAALPRLREDGGYIAFRDLDRARGWEPIGHKSADPGPFFLVWSGAEQTPENAFPWPWQIAAIDLVRFEDAYPAVVPSGASKDSAAYRGYRIFKARCIRCHSMNRQGGKVGPDLNAPQSVTAYRSKRMIKEFIRHPSKYRHTQMPDHADLSEMQLDDLYRYFKFKSRDSERDW